MICSLFLDTKNTAPRILATALKLGDEYEQANETTLTGASNPPVRWNPPEEEWYKINTDAGLVSESGEQVGVIVRDSGRHYVTGAIHRFPHVNHLTLLEAYGYKTGLELAEALGLTQVIIESDCKSVVSAMTNKLRDRSDLAIIIEDCLEIVECIAQVRHHHILRTANGAAHAMAKLPCLISDHPLILFT